MPISELTEEILEAFWIYKENTNKEEIVLSELREVPDEKTLKELVDEGVVKLLSEGKVALTAKGVGCAADAIRRHRLSERLLADILTIKDESLHDTACQFEHHLKKGVDTSVCTLLGHPRVCPHGREIPKGRCCEEGQEFVARAILPLAELKPGQKGEIAYLHTTDPKRAQMLVSMGVVPGVGITLLAGFPSYLFQIGESQFAIDRSLAEEIKIRKRES